MLDIIETMSLELIPLLLGKGLDGEDDGSVGVVWMGERIMVDL